MESSESTLHCSFIIYLGQDEAVLPSFLQDLKTFFQKFPLRFELVIALGKNSQSCAAILESHSTDFGPLATLRWFETENSHRAEGLREALRQAQGPYLVILSPEMATPLGDCFKILQHLMTTPQLSVSWGERHSKPTQTIQKKSSSRLDVENLFNKILQEKSELPSGDWLCEVGGMSKKAWNQIDQHESGKWRGYYASPFIHKTVSRLGLSCQFIFVHDSGRHAPSFKPWTARWSLFLKSVL